MRSLKIGLVLVVAFFCGVLAASQSAAKRTYLVVQMDVTNPQQYQEYAKLSPDIIARYGGRFLARAGRTETLEGPPAKSRVAIVEFPSFARAEEFYRSPEYVAAKKLREGAGDGQFVLVEAVD